MLFKKEIGSYSNLPIKLIFSRKQNELPTNGILLSTGRDCLEYIIQELGLSKTSKVLFPSYLCEFILKPFANHNITRGFYRIDENLKVDIEDLKQKIKEQNVSAVLVINYFGFIHPNIKEIKSLCRQNRVFLIEDAVDSFLSDYKPIGDFVFNSYRKFLFVPDGALLTGKFGKQINLKKSLAHSFFVGIRVLAALLKNVRIFKPIHRILFLLAANKLIDAYPRPAKISRFSKHMLQRISLDGVKQARRKNYNYLLRNIKKLNSIKPLYSQFPSYVFPLGFPIVSKCRNKIKKVLIKNKIYPPIHWVIPNQVNKLEFKDSYKLCREILTIPIDQRYTLKDMKRIIKVLSENEI